MARLRMDPHAQWEIREFAGAMYDLVKPLFPEACSAFEDYAVNAVKFSAGEYDLLKNLISYEKWILLVEKYGSDEKALGQDAGLGVRELKEFKEKLGL
jgi:thymidylate synthase ThyX